MDFSDTPEEAAYREEVRAWLRSNAPASSVRVAEAIALLRSSRLVVLVSMRMRLPLSLRHVHRLASIARRW